MNNELRRHVLKLQRDDGATELLDEAVVGLGRAWAVGVTAVFVHQRLDLFVRAVEAQHQRVAGISKQGVEALQVVAGDQQTVLQVGGHRQAQPRGAFGLLGKVCVVHIVLFIH